MDRLIYTAMTGAKQVAEQQTTVAHNLANVGTGGFRAQIDAFRSMPVPGGENPTRAQVQNSTVAADFAPGAIQRTGRALDVALSGAGWLSVPVSSSSPSGLPSFRLCRRCGLFYLR